MSDNGNRSIRFFYGLQPRWLSSDRLYRVYVCDKMVSVAYVAGQFYDEQSANHQFLAATHQLPVLHLLLSPLIRRFLARRQERESLYDTIDPFSRSLLDHDARNFQIWRSDVAGTRFRRNRSRWTPFNAGVVELKLLDGKTLRFILVGDQQPDEVLRIMQGFDSAIEVTGKPHPKPLPEPKLKPMSRFSLAMVSALFLSLGVLSGFAVLLNWVPDPGSVLVAGVNSLLLGLWLLVKAWKFPASPAESVKSHPDS